MPKFVTKEDLLFEIVDVFGKKVRTTKEYWNKIKTEKHSELKFDYNDVLRALTKPDEVYLSVRDPYIRLFYKNFTQATLVVLVKYLNKEKNYGQDKDTS